jgi:hypothetical protein
MIPEDNLLNYFNKSNMPSWPCPICKGGTINILDVSLSIKEHERKIYYYNIINKKYRYSCLYECSNKKCEATVFSIGVGYGIGDQEDLSKVILKPTYFDPPIRIISTTESCPENVDAYIIRSSKTFFMNNELTANSLRVVIENILSNIKVPTVKILKNGRKSRLSLAERINLLAKNYTFLSGHFDAIRLVGNSGSHGNYLTKNEIIMAYRIIEDLINEIYEEKSKKLASSIDLLRNKRSPKFP